MSSAHMLWHTQACSLSGRGLAAAFSLSRCGVKFEEWSCHMAWAGADYSKLHMAFRPAAANCQHGSLPR